MKYFDKHNFVDTFTSLDEYTLHNIEVKKQSKGNVLSVKNKDEEAYVLSPVFETKEFTKLVGSWTAYTSLKSSIEVQIRVKIKDEFTKYFSYGVWSLGGENLYYNQDDVNAEMSVDEILLKNDLRGTGFQYKVILKNEATLSLVCVSLKIPDYIYPVDISFLPAIVDYDVPKLNQNIVPVIGHEMCSATTTAMLLKFKGLDFKKYDSEFEHRYIASLVADRGHNSPTFGNWVYNTAVLASFGYYAYVARMYSWEELKYHLAKVGPVGVSIRGNAVLYNTGGHLIVVRGYKEVDGKTYVICNDPNINNRFGEGLFVYYEYPLEVFMNFWRGVTYVIL